MTISYSCKAQTLEETGNLIRSILANNGKSLDKTYGNYHDREFYQGLADITACRLKYTQVEVSYWKGEEQSRGVMKFDVPLGEIDINTIKIDKGIDRDNKRCLIVRWDYVKGAMSKHRWMFTFEGKMDPETEEGSSWDSIFLIDDQSAANQLANAIKHASQLCRTQGR